MWFIYTCWDANIDSYGLCLSSRMDQVIIPAYVCKYHMHLLPFALWFMVLQYPRSGSCEYMSTSWMLRIAKRFAARKWYTVSCASSVNVSLEGNKGEQGPTAHGTAECDE